MKKVLVAMSGGVDSSVAAALLLEQGYHVEGVTMQIWQDIEDEQEKITQGCCSLAAVDDARRVAMRLGIKYHVFNFKDAFQTRVINPFIDEYIKGRTPNPCILCNKTVKFENLLQRALALDFDYIATGHYGIIENKNSRYLLKRSTAIEKDQTYALYNLTQHQMKHLLLPIGNLSKPYVREIAKKYDLPVFDKPDSQEICFVKDNDYSAFIEKSGYPSVEGNFIDTKGNVIGRHKGIFHYTIGQRKGLGMTFGKPMFVVKILPETNEVMLGENADTFNNELYATELNWIYFDEMPDNEIKCKAKIRYNSPAEAATIYKDGTDVKVVFNEPARAITPGQSVVFYDGDYVIGGGIIK